MILFPHKPLKNPPFQTSQPQVKHAPESYSSAVRIDDPMISLQTNNLAKDLLRFHRGIAGGGTVAPQNKGEPTAVLFLYTHYAMGDETVLRATEDNVSSFEVARGYRLNRDQIHMANGGMHACSRGSEAHPEATAQQLSTEVAKMTKTQH
jgi:hypothetical protein